MGILQVAGSAISGLFGKGNSDSTNVGDYKLTVDKPVEEPFVWYLGDTRVLNDYYANLRKQKAAGLIDVDIWRFWGYPKLNIRKIHSGLPKSIVKALVDTCFADGFTLAFDGDKLVEDGKMGILAARWEEIDERLHFSQQQVKDAMKFTMVYGDGAFKFSFRQDITDDEAMMDAQAYAMEYTDLSPQQAMQLAKRKNTRVEGMWLEFVDKTGVKNITMSKGEPVSITFITDYDFNKKTYQLEEEYGRGYIESKLYCFDSEHKRTHVTMDSIPQTNGINPLWLAPDGYNHVLAVPVMFETDIVDKNRGQSWYDGMYSKFDAVDEIMSEWMDAYRKGKVKHFIPEDMVPNDPETGKAIWTNFDEFSGVYIKTASNMAEGSDRNRIDTVQPDIAYEAYETGYKEMVMDICQQCGIAPATLGINVSKMQSGESQREKEKLTLATRSGLTNTLGSIISTVIARALEVEDILVLKRQPAEYEVSITFGEYSSPTFDARVEVLSKACPGKSLMSMTALVEELWADSKSDEWKAKEVICMQNESGLPMTEITPPPTE